MNFWKTFLAALAAVVIGSGVVFILSLIFGFSLLASFGGETTITQKNSVLYIDLGESIIDSPNVMPTIDINSLSMESSITILQALSALEYAAQDPNIEELRQALLRFKQSGKFVVAYDDNFTQSEYYLASVADRVSMHPEGSIDWRGMACVTVFIKGLLDKLDVSVDIFRPTVCKYKSAVEPFFLTQMSEANREQLESLAEDMWTTICEDVAAQRNIETAKLKSLAANLSVNTPEEAKKHGLINEVEYEDELYKYLEEMGVKSNRRGELHKISLGEYANNLTVVNPQMAGNQNVGIIYADGQIVDGNEVGSGYIFGNSLAQQIREARLDSSVKSVVVRVNSPGGSALASDIIWREMKLLQESKPVVISMGENAASGGYYISAPADYIIANKLTMTGSIGVFGMIPNISKLLKNRIGITVDYALTSPEAMPMSYLNPMTERQKEVLLKSVDNIYTTFTSKVAEGRNLTIEQVYDIAEGRVWSGNQAVGNGLADANGGLHEAIAKAADLADLGAEFKLKEIKTPLTPFEAWLESMGMITAKACGINYGIYGKELNSLVKDNLYIFTHTGILMEMPQKIEVNL